MTFSKIVLTTALLALSLGAANASNAMRENGATKQPIGHALFCQQFAEECEVRSNSVDAPALTNERWDDIVEINAYANRAIEPVTDQEYYGVEEHWTYPRKAGDCEDYALLKRYMLMQRGWKASSLLITVVKQSNGEGHAVLTVRTSNGDFILDNLESDVQRWDKTGYRYIKRQSVNHTGKWTKISDRRSQVAGY